MRINLKNVVETTLSEATNADVLYIRDSCYASSAAIKGRRELLAACGTSQASEGAGSDHGQSFTRVLTDILVSAQGFSMTVAQLHGYMSGSYPRSELMAAPIHAELSQALRRDGSIVLAPLRCHSTTLDPLHALQPQPFTTSPRPKAFISVRLSDWNGPPDVDQWARWLSEHLPLGIEDVDIKLEGFYRTKTAIMLVLMPVVVWSVLRSRDTYEFVSLV